MHIVQCMLLLFVSVGLIVPGSTMIQPSDRSCAVASVFLEYIDGFIMFVTFCL